MGAVRETEAEAGAEVRVGPWRLIPKARVARHRLRLPGSIGSVSLARVTPVALEARAEDGQVESVAVRDTTREALGAMTRLAVAAPVVAVLVAATLRLGARRDRRE